MDVKHPKILAATQQAGLNPNIWSIIIAILKAQGGFAAMIGTALEWIISNQTPPTPTPVPGGGPIVGP